MIVMFMTAWAGCNASLHPPPDSQAVVWISPLNRKAGANTPLRVIPMAELKKLARGEVFTVGRLLQLLGESKKAQNPRRPWKVTVFEASSGALCRPIAAADETEFSTGLPVCPVSWSQASRRDTGCGTTVDRRTGKDGVELFRARWRDLAPGGFCVMPLDRFVKEL